MRSEASRKQQAEYHRKRNLERKTAGLCIKCGLRPPCAESENWCDQCIVVRRKLANDWYSRNSEKGCESSKRFRESLRTKGLCLDCGKVEPLPDRWRCRKCLDKSKIRTRAYVHVRQQRHDILRLEVFGHYGGPHCACCGERMLLFLSLDHIENDGAAQRKVLRGQNVSQRGIHFYSWLRKRGFPPGFQVLCMNCNFGKHRNGGICPHKSVSKGNV